MTEPSFDIQHIFSEAIQIASDDARSKYLDEACRNDQATRLRIEALLRAHFQAGNFLGGGSTESPMQEQSGTRVGKYLLAEKIGEGGMGVVYAADQEEPVKRRVALKIIKPGMDTRQVIARFEAERQALAMMDHPNIAKVLDAGQSDRGQPYFVMELVDGRPVTLYCDELKLNFSERLALFVQICHAVQHAHQKGFIHRDLKPSNILVAQVDGHPAPKVIDFGVAKATGPAITDKALTTQLGQIVGTLEYMSPEQAQWNQPDIDTRSDIYSLGAILYELLTGTTPFQIESLRKSGNEEILRIIREDEPPRPSARLSSIQTLATVAAVRGIEPRKMPAMLRGELDWIVFKAIEKDRSRRYESANGLAADILNYLADEPVSACPPSASYRAWKFAYRNRIKLAFLSFFAAILTLTAIGLIAGAVAWQQSTLRAESEMYRKLAERNSYSSKILAANSLFENGDATMARKMMELPPSLAEQKDLLGFEWSYLRHNLNDPGLLKTLPSQSVPLRSLACSADGDIVATGRGDGKVMLWNKGLEQPLTIQAHAKTVGALALSPDGERLASGGDDGLIKLWSVASGDLIFTLEGHKASVESMAFSPSGKQLASASYDKTVKIWSVENLQEVETLFGHDDRVTSVAFHPSGEILISGSIDKNIIVWDLAKSKIKQKLTGHAGPVWSVDYSPDGSLIASGSFDKTIRLWDGETGDLVASETAHTNNVTSVNFADDGLSLFTGGGDGRAKMWQIEPFAEVAVFAGHTKAVGEIAAMGVDRFATVSSDGTAKIWSASSSKLIGHKHWIFSTAFSDDNKTLATASGDKTVKLWDIQTGKLKQSLAGHTSTVYSVAFLPSTGFLASAGLKKTEEKVTGEIILWDLSNSKAVNSIDQPDAVYCIATTPDGKMLLAGSEDGTVTMFDVTSTAAPKQISRLEAHKGGVRCISVSPHRNHFATGGTDNSVVLWDLAKRIPLHTLQGHEGSIFSVAFSPDGTLLASAGTDGRVIVWNVATAGLVSALPVSSQAIYAVSFTSDGRRLVTGGSNSTMHVWNVEPKRIWNSQQTTNAPRISSDNSLLLSLHGHTQTIWSIAVSPDGNTIATGSQDMSARLWRSSSR